MRKRNKQQTVSNKGLQENLLSLFALIFFCSKKVFEIKKKRNYFYPTRQPDKTVPD